jgi:hypothetical protein
MVGHCDEEAIVDRCPPSLEKLAALSYLRDA